MRIITHTNTAYSTAAYSMGTVFLHQLKYIIGEEIFYKGMRQYYNTWKFKHPEPNDFITGNGKSIRLAIKMVFELLGQYNEEN